jgi:GntR family transcriptional regulator/MocR family aminotransferase
MDLLFELNVSVAPKGSREVSSNLYRQLRSAILDGRLRSGTRLPSTRNASAAFGVSRNTAQDVYDLLAQDGLVMSRHGAGTFVGSSFRPARERPDVGDSQAQDSRVSPFWARQDISEWIGFWRETREDADEGSPIELRPAIIDPKLFPHAMFRQVMARQLRRLETRRTSFKSPQGNQGNYQLRKSVADHIGLTRAVACTAEDVMVTSGAQQAFDLIARTLVEPGRTVVAIENPGYPPMRVPFAAAGARLVPVRADPEGIVVDEIPPDANVICVCPSHQFPLGMAMSPQRRKALLAFARRTGAVVVEDDYDGEFRYEGSPFEALRGGSSSDIVFYVGSFSKCMFPSLRLGFLIPPQWALPSLVAAKNSADWHCSIPLQMAVGSFIRDGHLARHVRRLRRIYRERRERLLELLGSRLGDVLDFVPSFYGMHVAALARREIDCEKISNRLAERNVMIHSLDRYFLGAPAASGFVISYAAADAAALDFAVAAMAEEISSMLGSA